MKRRLIIISILFLILMFSLTSCNNQNKKTNIISTSFAGYDFAKEIAGDMKTSSMLLNPGEELHDYSPSVSDIERIINSEIFIYIGGESDEIWVEKQILPEIDTKKTKIINMVELVKEKGKAYNEEAPESQASKDNDEDEELDEHVWNSISNAKIISEEICNALCEIDSTNKDKYIANNEQYNIKLNNIDSAIKNVIKDNNKNLIVFADRFPLLYFVKEYNLEYDAAFKGCETAKEANPKTIELLTKKIIDNDLKIVFIIELSESNIADTVIKNCKDLGHNIEKRTFYTMHNVSKEDYKNGTSYIDFMNKNIECLREALS